MILPSVKKIGLLLNLERTNNQVIGKLGNTFIRLYEGSNVMVLEMTFPQIDQEDKESISSILDSKKIKNENWLDSKLVIRFFSYSVSKILEVIRELNQYSMKKYKDIYPLCEECKSIREVEPYEVGTDSVFLCNSCQQELHSKLENERENYSKIPTNYVFGSFGAFLFSIPGVVITVLLFIFLGNVAVASSIVYLFLATKGYFFFKGKLDRMGAILINFIGVLMTIIGIYVSYILFVLYKTRSIDLTSEMIRRPEVIKGIELNVILAMVISLFYIAFNTFKMLKNWKIPRLQRARKLV